jgi:hypothetical protein
METIWVYKPPQCDYILARRTPFGFFAPAGGASYTMIQGVAMATPKWDWTQRVDGVWYAGLNGLLYQISDLILQPLRSGPSSGPPYSA